jgi:hypothetical protein
MKTFSWQTPEYVHAPKTSDWYWTVGIITGALVITSMIFGNFLFAIVLAIGTFSLTLFTMRKPNTLNVEITDKGIRVDKMLYPFNSLDAFGIDTENPQGARLFLKSKKVVMPLITLPLAQQNPEDLQAFLADHLKEDTFDQGVVHSLLERIGF